MTGVLNDKVVVVTGSSRGLGLEMARACAGAGARIVVSARSGSGVEAAVTELRAGGAQVSGIACDVSDRAQVEALLVHALDTYGRVDVWFNNAGYPAPYGPTAAVPRADFLQTIQTNIVGTYNGSMVALGYFLPRRAGKLINILGRGDTGGAVPLQNAYASSKSWMRTFTLSLAKEYAKSGVGIYAFNPGMMSTAFLTRVEAVAGYEDKLKVMPTIIRMWSNPPAVPAQRAVWLASPATDGKTGLEIHEVGRTAFLTGALREGLRRLTGQRPPKGTFEVITVPAVSDSDAGLATAPTTAPETATKVAARRG
jgi:glucose 1-dehydrogenase